MDLSNVKTLTFSRLLKEDTDFYLEMSELLDTKKARQIIWHEEHDTIQKPRCTCGKELSWHPDERRYREYCSTKCSTKGSVDKRKATCLEKYGVDHYAKTAEYTDRVKQTSIERFGVEYYAKTAEAQIRNKKTNLERRGVEHPAQDNAVRQKMYNTNEERHGDRFYNNREQFKKTNLERFGVDNFTKTDEYLEKTKATKLQRYGDENFTNTTKIAHTRKLNYYTTDTYDKLHNADWLKDKYNNGVTIGEIANELGVSGSNLCKYFRKYNIDLVNFRQTSAGEREIQKFITDIGVEFSTNNRTILGGKELDIYIESAKLAIEFNGVYWHTERTKTKDYHLNKTNLCEKQGIQLLHIWNYEWEDNTKREIWKSMIRSRLQLNNTVYARKCKIQVIEHNEAKEFFNKNHISGFCGGSIKLGLYYNNELIQAIIVGRARFTKKYKYELIRACSILNTNIVGGLSKLLSKINNTLISYADRRYSTGAGYSAIGMKQLKNSPPNYYYTKNNYTLESRNKFQKHKLKELLHDFDDNLTEVQNMRKNGYDRVWDAGQLVFTLEQI